MFLRLFRLFLAGAVNILVKYLSRSMGNAYNLFILWQFDFLLHKASPFSSEILYWLAIFYFLPVIILK